MLRQFFERFFHSSSPAAKSSLPTRLGIFIVSVCVASAAFEAWQDYRARERELAKIQATNAKLAESVLQHAEDTIEIGIQR
jgi:hypothetical protein